MNLYLIFFHLSVVLHSPVILNSSEYEIIILKYCCSHGWAGPIDEWAVLTYGSEQIWQVGQVQKVTGIGCSAERGWMKYKLF